MNAIGNIKLCTEYTVLFSYLEFKTISYWLAISLYNEQIA